MQPSELTAVRREYCDAQEARYALARAQDGSLDPNDPPPSFPPSREEMDTAHARVEAVKERARALGFADGNPLKLTAEEWQARQRRQESELEDFRRKHPEIPADEIRLDLLSYAPDGGLRLKCADEAERPCPPIGETVNGQLVYEDEERDRKPRFRATMTRADLKRTSSYRQPPPRRPVRLPRPSLCRRTPRRSAHSRRPSRARSPGSAEPGEPEPPRRRRLATLLLLLDACVRKSQVWARLAAEADARQKAQR